MLFSDHMLAEIEKLVNSKVQPECTNIYIYDFGFVTFYADSRNIIIYNQSKYLIIIPLISSTHYYLNFEHNQHHPNPQSNSNL